jgi:hypothetical protein
VLKMAHLGRPRSEINTDMIRDVCQLKRPQAARELGVSVKTLSERMRMREHELPGWRSISKYFDRERVCVS